MWDPVSPPFEFDCMWWWQQKHHHCRLLLPGEAESRETCSFLSTMLQFQLSLLWDMGTRVALICAVFWLQLCSCLQSLTHGGSFASRNSHAGSCQQHGAGVVVPMISASLLQQHLIHPALPSRPFRYPVACPQKPALKAAS